MYGAKKTNKAIKATVLALVCSLALALCMPTAQLQAMFAGSSSGSNSSRAFADVPAGSVDADPDSTIDPETGQHTAFIASSTLNIKTTRGYKITFNANGGTVSGAGISNDAASAAYTVYHGKSLSDASSKLPNGNAGAVTALPTATYASTDTGVQYHFDGWYLDTVNGTQATDSLLTDTITADRTYVARWVTQYQVTFNPDNGSASTSQWVDAGGTVSNPPADPEKFGYDFMGWYNGDVRFDAATTINASTTFTAKWEPAVYNIYYDRSLYDDGAGNDLHITGEVKTSYHMGDDTFTIDAGVTVPYRDNYDFGGWKVELVDLNNGSLASGTGVDSTGKVITIAQGTYGDLKITANWIQHDLGINGTDAGAEGAATLAIRTFHPDNITTDGFVLRFDTNGGSSVPSQRVPKDQAPTKPANPTKTGHDFAGWYVSLNDGAAEFDFTQPLTGNTTAYAKWTAEKYTVTFNSNGGGTVAPQTVEYGQTAKEPDPAPVREGYDFVEWRVGDDTGAAYNFASPVTGDIKLVAAWQIKTYTVTFDVNGGAYIGDNSLLSQKVNHGNTITRPTPDPTLANHDFLGWFQKDASGNFMGSKWDFNTSVTGNMTLYANWTQDVYTFRYYMHTSDTPVAVQYGSDQKVTMPKDGDLVVNGTVKAGIDGHKLSHWYASKDKPTPTNNHQNMSGTSSNYFAAGQNTTQTAEAIATAVGVAGNTVDLYATWTPVISATTPLRTAVEFGSATSLAVGPEMAIESTTPRSLDIAALGTVTDGKAAELNSSFDAAAIVGSTEFSFPVQRANDGTLSGGVKFTVANAATTPLPAGTKVGTVSCWPQTSLPGTGNPGQTSSKLAGRLCIQFSDGLMNSLKANVLQNKEVKDFAQINWAATMNNSGEWLYADASPSTTAF